jgi:hypothetical protein
MILSLLACAISVPLSDVGGVANAPRGVDHQNAVADWLVDCNGGADFESIGEAIDAAEPGETIDVRPCTYAENIDFGGKSLTLRSTGDSSDTVIEARGGSVVRVASGESDGTAMIGFTLSGGNASDGAAVYIDFASLSLQDVLVTDNEGTYLVESVSGDLELDDVTFAGNSLRGGVLVYSDRGGLVAKDSTFACDNGSYIVYSGHGSAYIDDSSLSCSGGYAQYWEHTVGQVRRSVVDGTLLVESELDHYDDKMVVENSIVHGDVSANYGSLVIRNSVIDGRVTATNTYTSTVLEGNVFTGATCAITGALIVIADTADTADTAATLPVDPFTVRNNLFWDVTRPNCTGDTYVGIDANIAGDPLFADFDADDMHPGAGSPVIDAGPEDTGYEDVDGSRNDIGVYGGHGSMDGGW